MKHRERLTEQGKRQPVSWIPRWTPGGASANRYTRGHSQKIIGDHIGRHPARRERLVIATKLERTVEGELIPMALKMGLGLTPWSPLKSGVLSGKYTRENAGKVQPACGEWASRALTERAYQAIDVLLRVARELDSTAARVALAWVQGRPGVASTIIGVRSLTQLDDNSPSR